MDRGVTGDRGRHDELAGLLDDISTLQARLTSSSAVDTRAIDAELNELAERLRASEQKLKARRRLDTPR